MSTNAKDEFSADPIVEEVRKAGAEMAREAGYDLHLLCERLREAERRHPERLVTPRRFEKETTKPR